MKLPNLQRPQLLVFLWADLSFLLALLPHGVGGVPRAVNAVLFMTLGPACAVLLLLRSLPPVVAVVVGMGVSLGTLIRASQALLILGIWTAWGVAGIVAITTIGLTLLSEHSFKDVRV